MNESSQSGHPPRRPLIARLFNPWVTIPFGLLLVMVSAPFVYRASRLNGVPRIEVFDVDEILDVEVDPNAGCWPEFRRVDRLLGATDEWSGDEAELLATLAKHRVAVEAWRDAAFSDYHPQRHPRDLHVDNMLPLAGRALQFARLSRLAADVARDDGRVDEAWTWIEATLRTSRHLTQGSCGVERTSAARLLGIASESIVDWSHDDRVSVEQLMSARRVLADLEAATPPISETLELEYALLQLALETTPLERYGGPDVLGGPDVPTPTWLDNEPELGRRLLDHEFAHALEATTLRWHELERRRTQGLLRDPRGKNVLSATELEAALGRSIVARGIGFANVRWLPGIVARESATFRALDVILAAELHRRSRNAYPRRVRELVPKWLAKVPEDSFAAPGTPMQFAVDEGRPRAWSIGPNGVDDDGVLDESSGRDDVGIPKRER